MLLLPLAVFVIALKQSSRVRVGALPVQPKADSGLWIARHIPPASPTMVPQVVNGRMLDRRMCKHCDAACMESASEHIDTVEWGNF